jgi:hypothetical protein
MKRTLIFSSLLAIAATVQPALAKEEAFTVRPTEIKEQPFSDAVTRVKIAENIKVEVLLRKGSWMQISAPGANGWIKMLSVRFEIGNPSAGKDNSELKSIYNLATTGNSGSTVTTATRSFDDKQFKQNNPNPQSLASMQSFALSKADAQKFSQMGKLQPHSLGYLSLTGEKP